MTFEQFGFNARILSGVEAAGFTNPTPIQEQAIPAALEGGDVLGLAQTGTGKTAAFVLPILQRLLQGKLRHPRVLIVAPTRELAEQIHETVTTLGKETKVRSIPIYGGVSKTPQLRALHRGAEIIVACPGRLLDLHNEGAINLSKVEVLVLDEADRMFDMGFLPDIRRIIKLLPTQRQNLFFSATMPGDIRKLADEVLRNPTTVQIGMIAPAKTVSHALYPITQNQKTSLLLSLLDKLDTDRVLIFTRTKRRARNLASTLQSKRYRVTALQGNMSQPARQSAMDGFRTGKYEILVATDIAARGIDVAEISHVINFDMPDTVDAYTHRIGRTGRAHANGDAFTFAVEDDVPMIQEIEKLLKEPIEQRQLEGFNYSGFTPEIVVKPSRSQNGRSQNGQSRNGATGGQDGEQTNRNGNSNRKRNRRRSSDRHRNPSAGTKNHEPNSTGAANSSTNNGHNGQSGSANGHTASNETQKRKPRRRWPRRSSSRTEEK